MGEIKIPFNDWSKERLERGDKIATTRTKKYGNIGDTFLVDFHATMEEYELLAIFPLTLENVAKYLYHIEGAKSPDEFKEVWCQIHKRMGWEPCRIVYVHLFHGGLNK